MRLTVSNFPYIVIGLEFKVQKRLAILKYAQFLTSITLLLLQRLVDLKRQFYGYLPAGYQNCRRAKQSTLDTA